MQNPLLEKAVQDTKDYIRGLTPEEKIAADIENFNPDDYLVLHYSDPVGNCLTFFEMLKMDVEDYRKNKTTKDVNQSDQKLEKSPILIAIQELKDYVATLTDDERQFVGMKDFDYPGYLVGLYSDPNAERMCLTLIKNTKKHVEYCRKVPLLRKAMQELRDYDARLTDDERNAIGMDDFDYIRYPNQFTHDTDANAAAHCMSVITDLKKDLKDYRKKKTRAALGLTIPKLLARYMKLPDVWRVYVRTKLGFGDREDIEKYKDKEDNWVFTTFAKVDALDDKDSDEKEANIDTFHSILFAAEEVQPKTTSLVIEL